MNGASPLSDFVEFAYVTNDLDASLALFRECFGVANWMETGVAAIDLGDGRTARLKIAVAFLGSVLIEIQQPVDGEIGWYNAVMPDKKGFAIRPHHLGFTASSLEGLDDKRSMLAREHRIPYAGAFGRASRYFFADARSRLGLWLEYIRFGAEFDGVIPTNEPGPSGQPAGRLADIRQLAWVTNDYDRALADLRSTYRIERVLETGLVETDLGDGKRGRLKVALGYVGDMQFELIAPIGGDVDLYSHLLPDNGDFATVFHHIGLACADRDALERQRELARAQGEAIPIHGVFGNSAFFYTDARHRIGHHLEYFYMDPAYDAAIPRN